MRLLLDTNAWSALAAGEREVARRVRDAERVLMSAVVVGELVAGFRMGSRARENTEALDRFLASAYVTLLPVSRTTAERYGRVVADLREAGRPIPTHDLWVAAHALETGASLLTRDAHFEDVPGLVVERF